MFHIDSNVGGLALNSAGASLHAAQAGKIGSAVTDLGHHNPAADLQDNHVGFWGDVRAQEGAVASSLFLDEKRIEMAVNSQLGGNAQGFGAHMAAGHLLRA